MAESSNVDPGGDGIDPSGGHGGYGFKGKHRGNGTHRGDGVRIGNYGHGTFAERPGTPNPAPSPPAHRSGQSDQRFEGRPGGRRAYDPQDPS